MAVTPAASAAAPRGLAGFLFIGGLGIGQIISWGTLYYSFPLIAEPMGREFGHAKASIYGALTFGLMVASLAAYPVGVAIDRGRGRAVLVLGAAAGGLLLAAWSLIDSLWALYAVMGGIGLVQAMTLYEPAFAVVARRFGSDARRGITALTLWGGFASTVFVPVLQVLMDRLGWRNALLALGLFNLAVLVALHLVVTRGEPAAPAAAAPKPAEAKVPRRSGAGPVAWAVRQPAFWGLMVAFTLYNAAFSAMTFHIYPLLLERGLDAAAVVGTIAMIGPAQVAGRVAVWLFGRDRPIRTIGIVAAATLPVSLILLAALPASAATLIAFAVIYGAANGVMTIVRGLAVPEMLTREAYGAINGLLTGPSAAAKALAPVGAAALWAATGTYDLVLWVAIAGTAVVVAGFGFAAANAVRR